MCLQKNECLSKRCTCRKSNNFCTTLCTFIGCRNVPGYDKNIENIHNNNVDNLNFESEDENKQAEEIVKEDVELSLLSDDEDYLQFQRNIKDTINEPFMI